MSRRDGNEERKRAPWDGQPVAPAALEEQLEDFLVATGVDDKAATSLRSEPEAVIAEVLNSGMRQDCRNPSSLLMSMIRTARQTVDADRQKNRRQIDRFVSDNRLDERCQEELYHASDEDLEFIFKDGLFQSSRNASAAIMTLLRHNLRPFIQDAQIDQSAQESLCHQSEGIIAAVIAEAHNIIRARNPSSMLMKKITELKKEGIGKDDRRDSRRSPRKGGGGRSSFEKDLTNFVRDCKLDGESENFLRKAQQEIIEVIVGEGERYTCARNPSAAVTSGVKQLIRDGVPGEKRSYDSGAEKHSGAEKRSYDSGARDDRGHSDRRWEERGNDRGHGHDRNGGDRWNVFGGDRHNHNHNQNHNQKDNHGDRDHRWEDRGDRSGRWEDKDRGGDRSGGRRAAASSGPPPVFSRDSIEEFLTASGVDEKASAHMRAQSDEDAAKIMADGFLNGRNPSALLMSRIRTLGNPTALKDQNPKDDRWDAGADGDDSGTPWQSSRGYREVPQQPPEEAPREPEPETLQQDAPLGAGDPEKELGDALEELHTAAWDRGLPVEDFEGMLRRVALAREGLMAAGSETFPEQRVEDDDGDIIVEEEVIEEPPPKRARPPTPAGGPPRPSSTPGAG